MINLIVYLICTLAIIITLFFSSKEDLRYHRISKKYVIIVFIVVLVYNTITGGTVEKTLSFMTTLTIFGCISLISRGQFGIGDTLILGAIGWFIGDMTHLQYYYITLSFCMLILGAYFVIINYKQNGRQLRNIFKINTIVDVENLEPGMVLANDYFMKGLKENDIEKIKKQNIDEVAIKQTYPFIPVIFVSFLIYVIIALAYIT